MCVYFYFRYLCLVPISAPMEIQRSRSMAQKLTLNETEQLDKNQRDLVQKYGFLQTRFKSKEYESMFRLYKSRHNAQLLSWVALIMVLMAVGQFIIFMATQAVSGLWITCTHTHMHTPHAHTHTHQHPHTHPHTHSHTPTHHTQTHAHTTYTHTHTHIHTHTLYAHMHPHPPTHTHTHTHCTQYSSIGPSHCTQHLNGIAHVPTCTLMTLQCTYHMYIRTCVQCCVVRHCPALSELTSPATLVADG